jgi:hypothetical protein
MIVSLAIPAAVLVEQWISASLRNFRLPVILRIRHTRRNSHIT